MASVLIAGDAMAKRGIVLICLVLLLSTFCSCSKRVENLDKFEKLVISAASETQASEPFASAVYVIIPKGCSAELAVRAELFVVGIKEKTGIKTYLKYDNESIPNDDGALQVLLGNTTNDISKDALRIRKADDYLYMYDRGALVIAGITDKATIEALDHFEDYILSTSSSASLMHEAAHFEYFAEYDLSTVKLNGFYLYDYAVKANGEVGVLGDALEDIILQRSGYFLDAKNPSGKNINIALDKDAPNGMATIETEGQNIYIRAKTFYGLSAAVANFAQLLVPVEAELDHCLDINEKIFIPYAKESVELLLGVVEEDAQASLDFRAALGEDLYGISADLLLFLNMSDTAIDYLKYDLRGDYEVISTMSRDAESSLVACGKPNVSFDAEKMCADIAVEAGRLWKLVILDSYDAEAINASNADDTIFLIREDDSLPHEYADFASMSFSFGGVEYIYRIVFSEKLLKISINDFTRENIGGSTKIFWNIVIDQKYHESFRNLQNSLN